MPHFIQSHPKFLIGIPVLTHQPPTVALAGIQEVVMKIIISERLIDAGSFSATNDWINIEQHIVKAIKAVEWPPGSGSFTLFDQAGKKRGEGSGVKPIKETCMNHLKSLGWNLETRSPIAVLKEPGKMDATFPVGERLFYVEWETGCGEGRGNPGEEKKQNERHRKSVVHSSLNSGHISFFGQALWQFH